jgi:hypothetical protein
MLVCDLCLLNHAVLVVSGLSEVLGALGQILLSYLVHMHSRLRFLRQGQVHVGPITWEVLPQHRSFVVGDLVLRRILTGEGRHKLSPLWEGPFIISEVTRPGSYQLTQMDGTEVGNSWNIEHLRKFYP